MERYDYTANVDLARNVPEELDRLTNKEMIALHEAIQRIRQDTEIEATTKHMEWFDSLLHSIITYPLPKENRRGFAHSLLWIMWIMWKNGGHNCPCSS